MCVCIYLCTHTDIFILFNEIKCLRKLNVILKIIIYNMCMHMKFDIYLGTQHVNG